MTRRFRQGLHGLMVLMAAVGLGLTAASASAAPPDPAAAAARPAPDRDRERMNLRVFDAVWNEVRTAYYDPRYNGVDWRAARETYRPRALAALDDRELYLVLDEMLGLLDDRHANASPPAVARRQDTVRTRRPVMGVTLSPLAGGDYMVEGVRSGSPAEAAGVRSGWRLLTGGGGWSPEMDVVEGRDATLRFADAEGVEQSLTLTPA